MFFGPVLTASVLSTHPTKQANMLNAKTALTAFPNFFFNIFISHLVNLHNIVKISILFLFALYYVLSLNISLFLLIIFVNLFLLFYKIRSHFFTSFNKRRAHNLVKFPRLYFVSFIFQYLIFSYVFLQNGSCLKERFVYNIIMFILILSFEGGCYGYFETIYR